MAPMLTATVLAYGDRACGHDTLIGVVPSTGTCLAATKMRMGSWEAVCRYSDQNSSSTSSLSGELKRRPKLRISAAVQDAMIASEDLAMTAPESTTTKSCEAATSALAIPLHNMVRSLYKWFNNAASSMRAKWSRLMTRIRQSTMISHSRCTIKHRTMSATAAKDVLERVNGVDRNLASLTPSMMVTLAFGALFMW